MLPSSSKWKRGMLFGLCHFNLFPPSWTKHPGAKYYDFTQTRLLKEDNWSGPSSWNCSLETIQYSLKFDLAWLSFIGIFFVHRLSLYVAVIADIIQSKKILLAFTFCLFQKTSLMLFFNLFYLADLLLQLSNVSTWAVWWNNQFWGIVIKNVELPLSANLIKGVVHHFKWGR